MGRRVRQIVCLLGLLSLLSGCLSQSGEDFYALPQLPEDYLALQQTIKQVMDTLGAEYAAPTSGSNVQNIQLQDLDGDGVQESAVAFFRVPGGEKPLKIYIFRQDPVTEEYETAWTVEGDGSAIYSVAFEDLGGGQAKEMVVSWQISSGVQSLSAYFLQNGGDAVELMRGGYTKSAVVDLDRDNEKEIVLVQLDAAQNSSRAELYQYDDGLMVMTSEVPLSVDLTDIQAVKSGCLVDQIPALFISSNFGEAGGRITDILAMRDGELTNLTLDESSGLSVQTVRYYKDFQDVNGTDINSDGILELPIPKPLALLEETGTQTYVLHWNQYDLQGETQRVCTTYHCYDDGWYLILPESWQNQVTIARRSSVTVSERAVSFYYWPPGEEEPQEFLTIYRLTGSSRISRATIDGRFLLLEGSNVVYAAKFQDTTWNCGLDGDDLRERFNLVKVDWSSDN
jgi:hypothetical protein